MLRDVQGPAGPAGPVLVGVHGAAPAEDTLRYAFAEAEHRGVELLVVPQPSRPGTAAWVDAVCRRARCLVAVAGTLGPDVR